MGKKHGHWHSLNRHSPDSRSLCTNSGVAAPEQKVIRLCRHRRNGPLTDLAFASCTDCREWVGIDASASRWPAARSKVYSLGYWANRSPRCTASSLTGWLRATHTSHRGTSLACRVEQEPDRVGPLEVGEHKDAVQFGAGAEDVYEEPADPRARRDPTRNSKTRTLRGQLIDCDEDAPGGAHRMLRSATARKCEPRCCRLEGRAQLHTTFTHWRGSPLPLGAVAAAVDHTLNGFDTETVVTWPRCGSASSWDSLRDSAASGSEDMVALDHGALDHLVDRNPAAGSATHGVATDYVADRMCVVREDRGSMELRTTRLPTIWLWSPS